MKAKLDVAGSPESPILGDVLGAKVPSMYSGSVYQHHRQAELDDIDKSFKTLSCGR